ncbi:hypothetical protein L6164_001261 [Bauhinia variegata]|uniref:Uncharacterized protein n=1 Tax=Bauhinia variegata TaxID=167791 RepID=A0ACB9QB69_BAUVA|nr:hypothetical protein L6164_001261 [Bauhinia variegata]
MKKYKDVQNEMVRSFLEYRLSELIIKFNNEMVGQCAQEGCGSKKAVVAVTSTDSRLGNPLTEPKQTTEASPQILKETQKKIVQSSPASEEPALITSLTASQEIEIETPQETDDLAKKGPTNKMIDKNHQELGEIRFQVHSEVAIKETEKDILHNCPAPDKPAMAASSTKSPSTSIISDETIKQTMDREGSKPKKAILEVLSTQELDEQQWRSEPFSTNQHQPLEVHQIDNIASNVVEEPVDSALKIAISEKSTTLAVSTDFKPKNSAAESLVFPTAEAYAEVIKNSANHILQNFQASKKPAVATSSAPSPSCSAILLQDTTSLVVREPVKSSIAESDAEAIAESKETQAQRTHNQVQERRAIEGSVVEELNRIEEDMKAFYASLEKECSAMPLPENTCTSIESVNVRASEETQRALEALRELLSKKFTLLLHPARSGLMNNVLQYLFSLSPEDGISSTMKPIMEELSRNFRKWSLDYGEANLKLHSATATLSKIDKLKEGLEANIKEFREVAKLENGICSHLAYLEARKRELEAEIADYKSAKDTIAESKRQVYEDGKLLKAEKEDLWKRVPQLRDEQEWAKTTKASIECEWSNLGQQFMENFGFGK